MKSISLILVIAMALSACGGGDPTFIAQCNGAPKAAVLYVGAGAPTPLAAIPDACVYSTDDDGIAAAVQDAKANAHVQAVYMIGNGTSAPLDYMATHPGNVIVASLWLTPVWSGDLRASLVSIYANGDACPTTSNHEGPVICLPALAFDPLAAIAQLQL